jgi:hypothetical protein
MNMRTLPRTWTPPGAPARNGLGDSRSTGAPSASTARKAVLNDRRSTR